MGGPTSRSGLLCSEPLPIKPSQYYLCVLLQRSPPLGWYMQLVISFSLKASRGVHAAVLMGMLPSYVRVCKESGLSGHGLFGSVF